MITIITRLGLVLGLLLLIGLVIWQGALQIIAIIAESGWAMLWIPLVWFPSLLPATQAWRLLFAGSEAPHFLHALVAMWLARSVNNSLPVANIGGEVVKARLINIWGCKGTTAAASVIVDKTVQIVSLIVWGLAGVALLLILAVENQIALYALAGFSVLTLCTVGLFHFQHAGMFSILVKLGGKLVKTDGWEGIRVSAKEVDHEVRLLYQRRRQLRLAVVLRTLALIMQSGEVWLACYLLGHPIGILESVMLKSLTLTLSDIAFMIPNAYGVQEGAFILLGGLVGLTPDVALAVSLVLRLRDLILDPPGLMALHHIESKRFLSKSRQGLS